ncbi:MAG: serine hydrolase, partial [Armatimonadota bacterium]|nr:serine hydrolase [Armatimonadota bacterium]
KALVGGMSLELAMEEGCIAPDDPACKFVPQWGEHPLKSQITIRHLASHTSGIEDAEFTPEERAAFLASRGVIRDKHTDIPGWKGDFWRRVRNPFEVARDDAPVRFHPGTEAAYSNPGIAMLTYAVTASLRNTPLKDVRSLLRQRILEPLGIAAEEWSIGYGETWETDGLPLVPSWGGGAFTARAVARMGRLMLHEGNWDGRRLLSPRTVQTLLRHSGTPSTSGLCWWVNSDLAGNPAWPALPADAFMGRGAGHQLLLGIPSLELIVVRNGSELGPSFAHVLEGFLNPLVAAVLDRTPYPRSRFIVDVEWAPRCSISRLATGERTRDGSDNWPMTWADDDCLYTAYGDGYGFEPSLPHKLGMGFARVLGQPGNFWGENIRSSGENTATGPAGKKACGMLMVAGVLYLLARNADGRGNASQLAWSTDHARTWTWCNWRFEELGHPTFVNFGRNYAGARDEFVYLLSHDHPSAYHPADRFVLARVPKTRLREREAYQFLQSVDADGTPTWTPSFAQRGAVFTSPGRCLRASVSFNAGLRRYLLWQNLPARPGESRRDAVVDTRYEGGFGVYEAPEPWGPWSTVFYTEKWDVGPGELGCFPTKWMSDDGRVVYLVFSGNDNFSVRQAILRTTTRTAPAPSSLWG